MGKPPVKRLFFDLETSPDIVTSWRTGYNLTISPHNILKERAIICVCWKWEGDKRVYSLEWDKGCDKKLCEEFMEEALKADSLVGHNGDRFDVKWFNTRCLIHGIDSAPVWKTEDTLKMAKSRFYFNSNKLDYIAQILFGKGKIRTEFGMWKDILLDNCPKAMAKMVRYCKEDVRLLERVYNRLSMYDSSKLHAGVISGGDRWCCDRCGSFNIHKNKTWVTAKGIKQHEMKCQNCNGYYRISNKVYKDYVEWRAEQRIGE